MLRLLCCNRCEHEEYSQVVWGIWCIEKVGNHFFKQKFKRNKRADFLFPIDVEKGSVNVYFL